MALMRNLRNILGTEVSNKHIMKVNNKKCCGYTDFIWKDTMYKNVKCPLYDKVSDD